MSILKEIKCQLEELKKLNAKGGGWEYFPLLNSIADNVYRYNQIYPNELLFFFEMNDRASYAAFPYKLIKQIEEIEKNI